MRETEHSPVRLTATGTKGVTEELRHTHQLWSPASTGHPKAQHSLAPLQLQLRRVCQPSPAQDRPQTGSHPCAGVWKEH